MRWYAIVALAWSMSLVASPGCDDGDGDGDAGPLQPLALGIVGRSDAGWYAISEVTVAP
jgi:hypothetical protein